MRFRICTVVAVFVLMVRTAPAGWSFKGPVSSPGLISTAYESANNFCLLDCAHNGARIRYGIYPTSEYPLSLVDTDINASSAIGMQKLPDVGDYADVNEAANFGRFSGYHSNGTQMMEYSDTCYIPVDSSNSNYPGADSLYAFHILELCTHEAGRISYPVYLSTPQDSNLSDSVSAYEVLIGWDSTCMNLVGIEEVPICGFYSEFFNFNLIYAGVVDSFPAVRVVAIRDISNNVQTPLIPPGCQIPIFYLRFALIEDSSAICHCDVKFIVQDCGDNTISTNNGLTLHTPYTLAQMTDSCEAVFDYHVQDVCPNTVPKDIVLVDGFGWVNDSCGGLVSCPRGEVFYHRADTLLGDVNLNGTPYENGDACFFREVLLGNFGPTNLPPGWSLEDWERAGVNSDINQNTAYWESGDLVLLTAIMSGYIQPPCYSVPDEQAELTIRGNGIYINVPVEIGAIYLAIRYEGEIGQPVLGEYAEGMTLDWNDLGGELRVLVWSPDHHTMPAGEGLLLKIPGNARFVFVDADIADYIGNTLSVEQGPARFTLEKAMPNPFEGTTEIGFAVASETNVNLSVYDISGKLVRTLINGKLVPGEYRATWDGKNEDGHRVKSGVYFVKMTAGRFSTSRKLMLLR